MRIKKELYPIHNEIDKITYKGECLWNNCKENSINSHSHTKNLLKNISCDNKIYGVNKSFIYLHKGEFFREYGINKASIFHGFCAEHDNSLFKSIEDHELNEVNNEAAFFLLTRSVFFEYSQKRTAILKIRKLAELIKKNNLDISTQEIFINRDFPIYKNIIYQIKNNCSYNEIEFLYKKINNPLQISLATLINPLFTQFIPAKDKEQPFFSLSILPYKNHGLITLCWLKKYNAHMNEVKKEFNNNFNKLMNYLCFLESEDFYFSIKLFNLSIKKHENFFKKALFNRASHPEFDYSKTKLLYNFENPSSF